MKKTKIRDRQVNGQTDGRTDRQSGSKRQGEGYGKGNGGCVLPELYVNGPRKTDRQTVDDDDDDVSKSSEAQPSMRQL